MAKFGIGQSVFAQRGSPSADGPAARYTDDIRLEGQTYAVYVRSPFAHAEIASIELDDAKAAPGVLGVFTGEDLAADGIGDIPCYTPITKPATAPRTTPRRARRWPAAGSVTSASRWSWWWPKPWRRRRTRRRW